jgi:hypothetical protein
VKTRHTRDLLDSLDTTLFNTIDDLIRQEDRDDLELIYLGQHPFDTSAPPFTPVSIDCYEACNSFSGKRNVFDSLMEEVKRISES